MRNSVLFGLICLLAVSCTQKRIIEYPDFDFSSNYISVYSIELADTATILRGNVYNLPNYWVKIPSETVLNGKQTGNNYKLLASPDFELNKEVFMPEAGTMPITLFFEPIDKKDIELDYVEDGSIDIAGLKLQPKKGKYHLKIRGTVICDDPTANRIQLTPYNSDARVNKWISIPVIDGKFEYELITDRQDPYEIIFSHEYNKGGWRPFFLFADNGEIDITCDFDKDQRYTIESTSPINSELDNYNLKTRRLFDYRPFYAEIDSLRENQSLYMPELQQLFDKVEIETDRNKQDILYKEINERVNSKTYEDYTPEAKVIYAKIDSLSSLYQKHQMDYLKQENPGLANYFCLAKRIIHHREEASEIQEYIDLYNNTYSQLFRDNLLTEMLQLKLGSDKLKNGGEFIDFTAPDLQGKEHTLSELIKGKVAIIDLWASWCGSCRRHSIELIAVYNEYKDKGFTVVGVARENNNTKAMEKAIEQDKYPWINLVELNDRAKIWKKYGAGNGGGIIIMVDWNGKVLAVNPDAEQVKAKLEELIEARKK